MLAFEAILFAALAVLVTGRFWLSAILVLTAADGGLALAARALVKASIVATTRPLGRLREGNAVLNLAFTVCMAGGPVIGGVVVGLASPQAALLLDAGSFAVAALLLGACSELPRLGREGGGPPGRVREGLAYVRAHCGLRRLLGVCGTVTLLGAAVVPIEVVLVVDTLGASEPAYGTVLALWGVGAVAGSALLPALRGVRLSAVLAGSFAVCAVSYIGMGSAGSVAVVCAFSLVGGVSNGIESYAALTAIQEQTAQHRQALVGGLVESVVAAATGIGFVAGGAVASLASARAAYIAGGLALLLLTVAINSPPVRARRGALGAPRPTG